MSRDKYFLAAQVTIGAYVIYQVATTVYQHLKAKDRLKRQCTISLLSFQCLFSALSLLVLKLLYKDNVN